MKISVEQATQVILVIENQGLGANSVKFYA